MSSTFRDRIRGNASPHFDESIISCGSQFKFGRMKQHLIQCVLSVRVADTRVQLELVIGHIELPEGQFSFVLKIVQAATRRAFLECHQPCFCRVDAQTLDVGEQTFSSELSGRDVILADDVQVVQEFSIVDRHELKVTRFATVHHNGILTGEQMNSGWKTFLLRKKDMIDSSDGLLNSQITRNEMKSVIRMSRNIECLIVRRGQVKNRSPETWTKGRLAGSVEPLDQNTFMTSGQEIRTIERERQSEDGQRMPVQIGGRRFFRCAIGKVVPESDATRVSAECETLFGRMKLSTRHFLMKGKILFLNVDVFQLIGQEIEEIDDRSISVDEYTTCTLVVERDR